MNIKLLSLVVPAYKQEKTIIKDIKILEKSLSSLPYNYEIIVVVDGFVDRTFQNAKKIKSKNVTVLGYKKNNGKGYAVKHGMLHAKGDVIGFIDGGMDINPTGISILLDYMNFMNADIIVGSKLHPESKVNYPYIRRILSWGYRTLTQILFGFKVLDTQVGLKIFTRKTAMDVFPRILVKRFAFDVEILAVAYALGYKKIYEAPIKLYFKGGSSITSKNFWIVIFYMLWDTAAVFYRLRIIKYYRKSNRKNWLQEQ
ncbi:MAG: glycosyltransferase family 2 protein [Candidatus Levybacteria bacterium CG_4_10_14_0_2_um_filter_36_16]|nr:MAG: hypothetical protein AUK12_00645 [Candidatus Levybacteria bacterium CG2_30_37_29]PIR78827.1 MAG: glycosyltransferase family 2 protein [Candidatus Levybacteria bacterium CG10_big_fil_rev_8_21_14_0_10_36_30]PIZ98032.1 MAG: glycosyltransferase family 2 protein [Candidatus Levybacteria bacterium CG_4_10_14_0_2_um_filter_36_16]